MILKLRLSLLLFYIGMLIKKQEIRRLEMNKLWKCSVCGYVHQGDTAPVNCPKCGAPQEKYHLLDEEATKKIYASDRTNDIHAELIALSMKIAALSEEGIGLNLDPACVTLFGKAKDTAWVIKQSCKAELAGHMVKGKF